MDLLRRQSELYVANAEREDRLRNMNVVHDRNSELESVLLEAEHELTLLRQRLQSRDPEFYAECTLYKRLVTELQKNLAHVGEFRVDNIFHVDDSIGVERTVEDRLKVMDTDNDGLVSVDTVTAFLHSVGVSLSQTDVTTLQMSLSADAVGTDQQNSGVSILGLVSRLRLYGLQKLSGEDFFWCAVHAAVYKETRDTNFLKMLQVFQQSDGYIKLGDILHTLRTFGLPLDDLQECSKSRWVGPLWFCPRS